MKTQELIVILRSIANCLEQWGAEDRSTFDQNAYERRIGAAFHDVSHLVKLDNFLRAMTEPLTSDANDVAPPTQRTGEEEPTKTQVDQLKPAEPLGCSTLPACDKCSGVTNAALCVDCCEANACEGPTSGDGKTCDG